MEMKWEKMKWKYCCVKPKKKSRNGRLWERWKPETRKTEKERINDNLNWENKWNMKKT